MKRIKRETQRRVRRTPLTHRLPEVKDGPEVVCSGYGPKLMSKYLVGKVVAMDDDWAAIEFPDRGDGKFRELYSVKTGVRQGDSKTRGWRVSIDELTQKDAKAPETVQQCHDEDKVKLLKRDRFPFADKSGEIVFEVWEHKDTGFYFQAYREMVPLKEGARVRRRPCTIPFHILKAAIMTFGGLDD